MREIRELCKDKNIAIVGNADSLLSLNKAVEIDSHDIVVRMNKSVLANDYILDTQLGRKCNVYTASGAGCVPIEQHNTNTPDICYWMTTRLRGNAPSNFHFFPNKMWKQLQIELCATEELEARPSTGLMVIYFILNAVKYKSVDIYGFDFWKTKTFYHPAMYVAQTHKPNLEKILVEKIVKEYKNVNFIGINT